MRVSMDGLKGNVYRKRRKPWFFLPNAETSCRSCLNQFWEHMVMTKLLMHTCWMDLKKCRLRITVYPTKITWFHHQKGWFAIGKIWKCVKHGLPLACRLWIHCLPFGHRFNSPLQLTTYFRSWVLIWFVVFPFMLMFALCFVTTFTFFVLNWAVPKIPVGTVDYL